MQRIDFQTIYDSIKVFYLKDGKVETNYFHDVTPRMACTFTLSEDKAIEADDIISIIAWFNNAEKEIYR